MLNFEKFQRFTTEATLGAADASKELMPAVSGVTYAVTRLAATCLVSAAQAAYVGDSSGTVKALSVAASFTLHAQARLNLLEGLKITAGEALIVKPAAAGPSFHVVVEGYIIRS